MPFSGDGSAAEATNATISVTGAGGYSQPLRLKIQYGAIPERTIRPSANG